MKKPTWLKDEAGKFWSRHAARLLEEDKLTDANSDSFALLCLTYAVLRTTDPTDTSDKQAGVRWFAALKQYQSMAKMFGLMLNLAKGQCADKKKNISDILKGAYAEPDAKT